ncbi:Ig-like domain repeat protein [Streptomyces sp. NPDC046203]|uniref:RCC1 domain-containing protein n=1 Tax=Streptomyces sp. NPDC046203 TaxID=3154602 RepID=UPI0033F8BB02
MATFAVAVLCLTGLAAPPAHAQQPPPTGIALSWGLNEFGQLGDGTTTNRTTPVGVDLPAGTRLTAVAAGYGHSLGLTSDGHVLAWGYNVFGQLGNGTTTDSTTPVEVSLPAGTQITAIAAGYGHSLGLTSDGRVLAWGWNDYGQLGDGTTTNRTTPVEVDLPAGAEITAVSASHTGYFSLALTSDGRVLAWGINILGQLGNGTSTGIDPNPTPIEAHLPAGTQATAIAAGGSHSLALTSDGRVLAWGSNYLGQLGDGTTTQRNTPVYTLLPADTQITALAAGDYQSLALTSDDHVLAWGQNSAGQLGDGTTTDRTTPVQTLLPADIQITALAAGGPQGLALTSDGRILAWGGNYYGELGDGTTTNRTTPVYTHLPAGDRATAIAAGAAHSLAPVVRATSHTTLTAHPTTATLGAPVTLTAHVTCDTAPPTGNVVFYDGTTPIGTGTLDASGNATVTTSTLPLGTRTITAHYEGDGTCPASVSEPVTVTVEEAQAGALHLTKQATFSGPFEVGDTVEYAYTVTNTGDSALSSVTVTDNLVTDVDCEATTLAPGASTTCHGTYTVTEDDATCTRGGGDGGYGGHGTTCPVTNTAHATATDPQGDTVTSNTATATIRVTSGGDGGHDGYGSGGYGSGYDHGRGRKEGAKTA